METKLWQQPLTADEIAWVEQKRAQAGQEVKAEDRLPTVTPRYGKVMSRYTLPRSTTKR